MQPYCCGISRNIEQSYSVQQEVLIPGTVDSAEKSVDEMEVTSASDCISDALIPVRRPTSLARPRAAVLQLGNAMHVGLKRVFLIRYHFRLAGSKTAKCELANSWIEATWRVANSAGSGHPWSWTSQPHRRALAFSRR